MKKRLLISLLTAIFFVLPASALDHGPVFGTSLSGSIKPFANESVGYKLQWDNFALDMGLKVEENLICNPQEPIVYLAPTINLYFGGDSAKYYLGGGLFFLPTAEMQMLGYVRTGCEFGNWQWGPGIGNMDIGIELSPTVFIPESENAWGTFVGTLVGTFLNFFKLEVGVTYMLPL